MKTRAINTSLTTVVPGAKRRAFSRRSVLTFAGTLGAAAPFGIFGAARALTASGSLAARTGAVDDGRRRLENAVALWTELGDRQATRGFELARVR